MATTTPNIGLTKPIGTEKYDLDVVNANSDIIDTEITDAKAGSNARIFKVKNDLTDQDNAVSRVSGDSRYIQISQSITAFIHLTYSHATDAVARFNQAGAGKIASFLQNGTEKSYIANDGNFLVNGIKAILANGIQALHATDALRISGQTLSLFKGDGSQEDVVLPAEEAWLANDSRVKTALNALGDAYVFASRAWVNFNGKNIVAIRDSGNVSSITDRGTGAYRMNFIANMPHVDYAVTGASGTGTGSNYWLSCYEGLPNVSYCDIASISGSNEQADIDYISVVVIA